MLRCTQGCRQGCTAWSASLGALVLEGYLPSCSPGRFKAFGFNANSKLHTWPCLLTVESYIYIYPPIYTLYLYIYNDPSALCTPISPYTSYMIWKIMLYPFYIILMHVSNAYDLISSEEWKMCQLIGNVQSFSHNGVCVARPPFLQLEPGRRLAISHLVSFFMRMWLKKQTLNLHDPQTKEANIFHQIWNTHGIISYHKRIK